MMTLYTPPQQTTSRRTAFIILAALIAFQALLVFFSFRASDDITNDKPILNVDFASQYYWAYAAREFHKTDKQLWGYDPNFMAGYPLSFVANSALPVQLTSVALKNFNLGRVIKGCFIFSILAVPLTLFLGLGQFGLNRGQALSAAALGTAYFWLGENGFYAHMGMISGAFLLHFFLIPAGVLFRFVRFMETRPVIVFAATLALAITIHKTAFVLVGIPAAAYFILNFRGLTWRAAAALAIAVILALAANHYWLSPFLRFLPLKIEDPNTTFFQNTDVLRAITDLLPVPPYQPYFGASLGRLLILVLAISGFLRMRKDRGLFRPVLAGIILMGAFAYFGSLIPILRHLQPYRQATAYYYLLLVPAGFGLSEVHERISRFKGGAIIGPAAFAALLVGLLLLPSFLFFSVVARLTTRADKDTGELISWVKNNTDSSARLLIEDINVWEPRPGEAPLFGGARIIHLIPLITGRECIGGPLPNDFIKHHHADLHDGIFLGRPISDFSDNDLADAMRVYNIGWAAVWSDEARARLKAYPGAKFKGDFGRVAVFEISRKHSFFLAGSGEVQASWNRITVLGVSSESGMVVISYHWVDGLVSNPPVKIERVAAGGDPVGFIGIDHPPPQVTLSLEP